MGLRSSNAAYFGLALALLCSVLAGAEVRTESLWALTFMEVRADARGHAGNVLRAQANTLREHTTSRGSIILLQELSRPERFVLLEREQPGMSASGRQAAHPVSASIEDELTAPPDRRTNREIGDVHDVTHAKTDVRANVYVVAHLDIGAPDRAGAETALRQLAAAARQNDGNLGFHIWQQTDRLNHFNIISEWISESHFRAFAASRASLEFRRTVGPLLGSPYDERLFRRVD